MKVNSNIMINLSDQQITHIYNKIKTFHEKNLAKHGVKLPVLKRWSGYTKDALVLVYLAAEYPNTRAVSKTELTEFVRKYYPRVNDVQQARHLGAQKGWYILSGSRGDGRLHNDIAPSEYKLMSLKKPFPQFHGHRITNNSNWQAIVDEYDNRCATCGSKAGEPNIHWPTSQTVLTMGHMDPRKELVSGNIIPQCEHCNRADRNRWVYDERGRVIKVSNPSVILSSSADVQLETYKLLYKKFEGRNPDEKEKK